LESASGYGTGAASQSRRFPLFVSFLKFLGSCKNIFILGQMY
jgi:hypothetical protein